MFPQSVGITYTEKMGGEKGRGRGVNGWAVEVRGVIRASLGFSPLPRLYVRSSEFQSSGHSLLHTCFLFAEGSAFICHVARL